jgi:uncharacterized protein YndB with AHSA1/START domain
VLTLDLSCDLPVPPERAWPWIAEPTLMSRWSEARIESVALGDADHPGGTGARRRVHLPGPGRNVLDEVVVHGDAPDRLVYQVIGNPVVLHHRGTQTITRTAGGARLRWVVEITLAARALEWAAERQLRPSLERSIEAMARLAREPVDALPLPPARDLGEAEVFRALRADAEAVRDAQRAWADRLLAADDDRGWFARVYQHVTEEQLAACDAGSFEHPGWVLRLLLAFHPLWERPLRQRLSELDGDVPAHWQRAHALAERAASATTNHYERAVRSIFGGMRAHIEDDLPRAMADVFRAHYAGRCRFARMRADYVRMAPIFDRAGERVQAWFPRSEWTTRARMIDTFTPTFLRTTLIDRTLYPITKKRRDAFETARAEAERT